MELDIRPKWNGWQCIFNIGEQEYLASLVFSRADRPYDDAPKCMIFKSKDGQFTFADAGGVYTNHEMPCSEEGLRQCIEEFIASQQ